MRAVTTTAILAVTALAAVGLSAASSTGAATDGLTSDALLADARFNTAFTGRDSRVPDDPDAPIRTGRWAEDAPAVELAGGPSIPAAGLAPPAPVQVALLPPVAKPGAAATAVLPRPSLARAAFRSAGPLTLSGGEPRVRLVVSTERDALSPGSGLDPDGRFDGETLTPRAPRESQPFDAKRILLKIAPAPSDRRKGRWFIFAAGSGEAFGLNLIKDPVQGTWRRAGWSVEKLAEFGKAQLGVGWRRGDAQVALSAARREIGAYGYKREDTVVGVTFTISGKPPAKARFEQRLPRR